jgi:1-pyrroline-5-carboxylate dehydrogenase
VIAEMGGKNPGIVMPSADLGAAAQALARSAFGMGGQKCNATSRALVHESVADEVAELVVAAAGEVKVGDPIERDVFYGPQIEARSIDRFTRSVEAAQADGTILTGGDTAGDGGYYVQPTVVTGLPRGHSLARDELFLPFLTLIPVASMDDAIEEANAIELGLTAGIFSQDGADVDAFLDRVQAGGLLVNHAGGMTTGIFPGTSTHGGWKASTLTGRHTFGRFWIQEFMHQQWVMQGVS